MNNKQYSKKGKWSISAASLIRCTGLFAIMAGLLFIVIQFIHPADHISSVNSASWVIVACLSIIMSLFFLIGTTGLYARQVAEMGWLGLVGFSIFSLFWLASAIFGFIEAFVLPVLITESPKFITGFLGIFGNSSSEIDLGILPALAPLAGALYLLGGLLLGIAVLRARVLPRLAAILLSFGAVVTLASAIIPHPADRILAIPLGLAFIWLGYALWSDRKNPNEK